MDRGQSSAIVVYCGGSHVGQCMHVRSRRTLILHCIIHRRERASATVAAIILPPPLPHRVQTFIRTPPIVHPAYVMTESIILI